MHRHGTPYREVELTGADLYELTGYPRLPMGYAAFYSRGLGDNDDSYVVEKLTGSSPGPTPDDIFQMREPFIGEAIEEHAPWMLDY